MTTFDFVPSTQAPFQFQPTFDGISYNVVVTWNLFGKRFYVNVYNLDGTWVYTMPLIGSPLHYDISMNAGYFTSTLVYRTQNRQFEVAP
jgi:hypothetical protein